MNRIDSFHRSLAFSSLVVLFTIGAAFADAGVVSPNSKPFGRSFAELSAEWWQLVVSMPTDINPVIDDTGARCAWAQHGPIWFLYGTFSGNATRTCTVPENKALFFPVINAVDVNTTTQTAKELRAEIAPCFDAVSQLSVTVDGMPLRNLLKKNRVQSVVFEMTMPAGNVFGIDPGIYSPAVDDGFYVMLDPLEPGPHTVHFSGAIPPAVAGCPFADGFSIEVTYNLKVGPVNLR